jgi:hypothetical protein
MVGRRERESVAGIGENREPFAEMLVRFQALLPKGMA